MMIEDRILGEAKYILQTNATIRQTAEKFGVSKSTVHLDMSKRLIKIDSYLYYKVRDILEYNFSVRHLRGGESTKRRYEMIKKPSGKGDWENRGISIL